MQLIVHYIKISFLKLEDDTGQVTDWCSFSNNTNY